MTVVLYRLLSYHALLTRVDPQVVMGKPFIYFNYFFPTRISIMVTLDI